MMGKKVNLHTTSWRIKTKSTYINHAPNRHFSFMHKSSCIQSTFYLQSNISHTSLILKQPHPCTLFVCWHWIIIQASIIPNLSHEHFPIGDSSGDTSSPVLSKPAALSSSALNSSSWQRRSVGKTTSLFGGCFFNGWRFGEKGIPTGKKSFGAGETPIVQRNGNKGI